MLIMSEKYRTGIDFIDDQHEKLFAFFNALEKEIQNDSKAATVQKAIDFMQQYVVEHFNDEENCMYGNHCHDAVANKKAHEEFIKQLKKYDIEWNVTGNNKEVLVKMHQYIERWFSAHILNIDTKLKSCPVNKGSTDADLFNKN